MPLQNYFLKDKIVSFSSTLPQWCYHWWKLKQKIIWIFSKKKKENKIEKIRKEKKYINQLNLGNSKDQVTYENGPKLFLILDT